MKTSDKPVVVKQGFNVSLDVLWKAITEKEQMVQWFFEDIPDFKPEVGFRTRFVVKNEGRTFPHLWKVMESDPRKVITLNWRYEGYEGDSLVRFELSGEGKHSHLILSHRVIQDFPQDIPEFTRESCEMGWNWFINKSLKEHLEKEF